ncbi:MAG: cob(I)yrinic acid a,c-diamide adenosyltransferase [Bacteroidaceae bacterium]|nr:cob(I)yrinic acid a,c-diamide adenosyltransferase [Bacteroidaceae bacterium]
MKIYTKTGDAGQTSLVGGKRVSKCCPRLESYGTVDELNSHIGLLITLCNDAKDQKFLLDTQGNLFVVGGYLATDNSEREVRANNIVTEEMVRDIEIQTDRLQTLVPPLRLFVLPGGTYAAAQAHICRTVCRRAERDILRLVESGAEVDAQVLAYMNRLSDYFFTLARKLNSDEKVEDIVWKRVVTMIAAVLCITGVAVGQTEHDSIRQTTLNPVVITGTNTYHKASDSPVAVKVITSKELQDAGATNLQDALTRLTTNITTHTSGMGTFVNFNGVSDDYILILENGKRVSGDDRWNRISLDNVKRIEVFSGAASALYGSDAIAGVINIITDDSRRGISASAATRMRSKGRMEQDVNVDVNTGIFSSYTSYNRREADNWQVSNLQAFTEKAADGSETEVLKLTGRPMSVGFGSHNISERMEWQFSDKWSAYIRGNYYDYQTQRPQAARYFSTPKKQSDGTYKYTSKQAYSYDLHHQSYSYGGGARWNPNSRTHIYLDVYGDNLRSLYDYWQTDDEEAYDEMRKRTRYFNETLRGIFRLNSWNKLSAGMELTQESLTSESDNISGEHTQTYNIFAQDEIDISSWLEAVAGVRYTYNNLFGSAVTPNAALFFHFGGLRLRASYSGGYRTPTLSQLYATDQAKTTSRYTLNNTSLNPEKNDFWQVNAEYANSWMSVSVGGFVNKIRDMINYRTMTDAEISSDNHLSALQAEGWTTIRQRDNIDRARLRGINTSLKFMFPFGLTIGGGYTMTDSRAETQTLNASTQTYEIKSTPVDKCVRNVGHVQASYDKTWKRYHLNVNVNGHMQGERYSSTYGYADGFSQWDLTTRHTITLPKFILEPGIGVENIFNSRDTSYWNSNFSTINPGRSVIVSLALRFRQ